MHILRNWIVVECGAHARATLLGVNAFALARRGPVLKAVDRDDDRLDMARPRWQRPDVLPGSDASCAVQLGGFWLAGPQRGEPTAHPDACAEGPIGYRVCSRSGFLNLAARRGITGSSTSNSVMAFHRRLVLWNPGILVLALNWAFR